MLPARLSNLRGLIMWWLTDFMKTLQAGDIVKQTDESRRTRLLLGDSYTCCRSPITHKTREDSWGPVSQHLVGNPILSSDLMHLEFRRPI
jgi:hypothetical protein